MPVAFVREEEGVPVLRDEATEAMAHIQQPELCPQIHEAIGRRGASQPNDTPRSCSVGALSLCGLVASLRPERPGCGGRYSLFKVPKITVDISALMD